MERVAFEALIVSEERDIQNYALIDELISGKYEWLSGFLDRHIVVFMRDILGDRCV